ncbi:MAG TPA: hypothetical protein VIJ92_02410 [Ginsengibacter sp.]
MNYIRHLNAFFSFVRSDNRLTSSHVSLYLALFQYWNFNRFQNPFPVYRDNMMQLSKIGSKNTYHKCMKELHANGYIMYHPSISKFQPVKISMLRLDIHEEENKFRQLDLFAQDPPKNQAPGILLPLEKAPEGQMKFNKDLPKDLRIKSGPDSVPDLTDTGLNIDTGTVPKLGQNIKQNLKQKNSVQNTPNKIFNKNEEISRKMNAMAGVPNAVHVKPNVTLSEVEGFFKQNKYPGEEAAKFFYYNQGKNWMLTEKLPITDWQSMAHKWILNSKSTNSKSHHNSPLSHGRAPVPNYREAGGEASRDIQYLYERLLDGEQISKSILIEHYDYLRLQVTDEVKQEAWQRRINQLTGSNENSENQLLEAYQTGDINNILVMKDEENLIVLAKRVAVFNYLKKLQQEGRLNVIDKDSNK